MWTCLAILPFLISWMLIFICGMEEFVTLFGKWFSLSWFHDLAGNESFFFYWEHRHLYAIFPKDSFGMVFNTILFITTPMNIYCGRNIGKYQVWSTFLLIKVIDGWQNIVHVWNFHAICWIRFVFFIHLG